MTELSIGLAVLGFVVFAMAMQNIQLQRRVARLEEMVDEISDLLAS